jgi:hypothetical protein
MPITCAYEWKQTGTHVLIEVPLKGAPAKAVDCFCTDVFVKVAFERYLLHLDLYSAVDDATCVAKIKQGSLILKLAKKEVGSWPSLVVSDGLGKEVIKARRAAALESKSAREEELAARVVDRKVLPSFGATLPHPVNVWR